MKFCKDCKSLWGDNMCKSPKLGQDIVTGKVRQLSAVGMHQKHGIQVWAGYWFEPRPVTKLSEVLTWLTQK